MTHIKQLGKKKQKQVHIKLITYKIFGICNNSQN